jgi:DNA-binding NarL/FixJ family response regulator
MIRVVIADDHHLVRQGIRALLEKGGDVQVVGEAADGQEALELVQRLLPGVLVLDIGMPRLSGMEVIGRLQALRLKTRVLVLSMYSDETLVRQALRRGATGYLLKQAFSEELHSAVRAVDRGEVFLSPELTTPLLARLLEAPASAEEQGPLARLTPREREVLQLIAEGQTNARIAKLLRLSEKTVEKHRGNLMAALDLHDTAALVRFAVKHGLVRLDP